MCVCARLAVCLCMCTIIVPAKPVMSGRMKGLRRGMNGTQGKECRMMMRKKKGMPKVFLFSLTKDA